MQLFQAQTSIILQRGHSLFICLLSFNPPSIPSVSCVSACRPLCLCLGSAGSFLLFFPSSKDKGHRIQLSGKAGRANQVSEEGSGAPACESEHLAERSDVEQELNEVEEVGETEEVENEKCSGENRKNVEVTGKDEAGNELEEDQSGSKDEVFENIKHSDRQDEHTKSDEEVERSAESQNDDVGGGGVKSLEESQIEDEVGGKRSSSDQDGRNKDKLDEKRDSTERGVSDDELNEGESDQAVQRCSRSSRWSDEEALEPRVEGGGQETPQEEEVEIEDEAGSRNPPGASESDEEVLQVFTSTCVRPAKLKQEFLCEQKERVVGETKERSSSLPAEVGFGVASVFLLPFSHKAGACSCWGPTPVP